MGMDNRSDFAWSSGSRTLSLLAWSFSTVFLPTFSLTPLSLPPPHPHHISHTTHTSRPTSPSHPPPRPLPTASPRRRGAVELAEHVQDSLHDAWVRDLPALDLKAAAHRTTRTYTHPSPRWAAGQGVLQGGCAGPRGAPTRVIPAANLRPAGRPAVRCGAAAARSACGRGRRRQQPQRKPRESGNCNRCGAAASGCSCGCKRRRRRRRRSAAP
jgi:hypothetical protein